LAERRIIADSIRRRRLRHRAKSEGLAISEA